MICVQESDSSADILWNGIPGYVPRLSGLWSVQYLIGSEAWAVGVAFHRKQDAELCRDWLIKHGYTPQKYHEERDDVIQKIKRDIISNLAW